MRVDRVDKVTRFFDKAEYIASRSFKLLRLIISDALLVFFSISGLVGQLRTWFHF